LANGLPVPLSVVTSVPPISGSVVLLTVSSPHVARFVPQSMGGMYVCPEPSGPLNHA